MPEAKVLICAKPKDPKAEQASQGMKDWLKARGHTSLDVSAQDSPLTEAVLKGLKLGVVFGGDGTLLTLVRRLERKDLLPLIGVNLGTLGFITQFGPQDVYAAVEQCLAGTHSEELRPLVQVELMRERKCLESGLVFNDAVVNKDARSSMVELEVRIDGDLLSRTRADGYIVATPTGSTGYSLSAGGALLHPACKAMILLPLGAHSLTSRSVVIPQNMSVEILVTQVSGPVYLVCDGQAYSDLQVGDRICVQVADTHLRMVRSPEQAWPEVLRAKLGME